MIKKSQWKWFGHPGHFICSRDCRFHLCTLVGKYLVSTVGELWGDRKVREIHAQVYDPKWLAQNIELKGDAFDFAYMERFGYQTIGHERTYETMVFKAGKSCDAKGCDCQIPSLASSELDFLPYNDAESATEGHMKLCLKWSKKK